MAAEIPAPLLKQVAKEGMCKHCFRAIWWFFTATGAAVPFDRDGTPHRQTCGSAVSGVSRVGGGEADEEGLLDKLPC